MWSAPKCHCEQTRAKHRRIAGPRHHPRRHQAAGRARTARARQERTHATCTFWTWGCDSASPVHAGSHHHRGHASHAHTACAALCGKPDLWARPCSYAHVYTTPLLCRRGGSAAAVRPGPPLLSSQYRHSHGGEKRLGAPSEKGRRRTEERSLSPPLCSGVEGQDRRALKAPATRRASQHRPGKRGGGGGGDPLLRTCAPSVQRSPRQGKRCIIMLRATWGTPTMMHACASQHSSARARDAGPGLRVPK